MGRDQKGHLKGNQKKYIQLSENKDARYQNLWNTIKTVLRRTFIALNVYIRKEEKSQINNLSSQPKNLDYEEKINPKQSEGKK